MTNCKLTTGYQHFGGKDGSNTCIRNMVTVYQIARRYLTEDCSLKIHLSPVKRQ